MNATQLKLQYLTIKKCVLEPALRTHPKISSCLQLSQKKGAETDCVQRFKGQTPKCYVSADTARKLQADDQAAVFMIFHELGHIVLGVSKSNKKDRNNNQHKIDALNQGIVDPDELAADAFAAEYIGLEDSIKALEESRDTYFLSFQHKILPDKTMPAKAYQKMSLRIEALKALRENNKNK